MVTLILSRASCDTHYDDIIHPSSTSHCCPASPLPLAYPHPPPSPFPLSEPCSPPPPRAHPLPGLASIHFWSSHLLTYLLTYLLTRLLAYLLAYLNLVAYLLTYLLTLTKIGNSLCFSIFGMGRIVGYGNKVRETI